jgi:lipoate-protein ligase A
MHFLDLTLPSAAENLALDEALLLEAEAGRGREVLRLWEWPEHAVILGAGCYLAQDVNQAACRLDGVPILRRSSGGGTVLLATGCLLYSLVLAYERSPLLASISSSYIYILSQVRAALDCLRPGIELAGTSDLACGGRKFSGNAQQRKQHHLLHHGTLLYDFDLSRVSRYLQAPPKQPTYRARREHSAFLVNLQVARATLVRQLRIAWQAETETSAWPVERVRQLNADKYGRPEWIRRR